MNWKELEPKSKHFTSIFSGCNDPLVLLRHFTIYTRIQCRTLFVIYELFTINNSRNIIYNNFIENSERPL